jgi:oxalate decarboxylase
MSSAGEAQSPQPRLVARRPSRHARKPEPSRFKSADALVMRRVRGRRRLLKAERSKRNHWDGDRRLDCDTQSEQRGLVMFSLTIPISSEGGHTSFHNNVPDPVTSGAELPTFKFELEKSQGRVDGASYGKEATVAQLPISKDIAGVSMRMEQGVMRDFVARDRGRVGFVTEDGCAPPSSIRRAAQRPTTLRRAITVFSARPWPCHRALGKTCVILVFDNGFLRFGVQHQRLDRPCAGSCSPEFGVPASTFDSSRQDVYFAGAIFRRNPATAAGWSRR